MNEYLYELSVKISVNAERKIKELLVNGGYDRLMRLGFGFLRDETWQLKLPHITQLIKEMNTRVVKRNYKLWELKYIYGSDNYGTTKIHFMNIFDENKPTMIFLHGFLGTNHKTHLALIANKNYYNKFNIVSIQMNGHDSLTDVRDRCANTILNFSLSIAGSVLAISEVISFHKEKGNINKTMIVGLSIGGVIASWHHFIFDTGDIYFPVLAYPNLGEIMKNSTMNAAIYNYKDIENKEDVVDAYELKEFKEGSREKVFPILARYDQTVPYKQSLEFWDGYKILKLNTAHYSAVSERHKIQEYILENFDRIDTR